MKQAAQQLWNAVKPAAAQMFGDHVANHWLAKLEPVSMADGQFTVETEKAFWRDWIKERYLDDLLRLMRQHATELKRIEIQVVPARKLVVGMSPEADVQGISFVHAGLCQVFFPRQKTEAREHERSSGSASLLIQAGKVFHRGQWLEVPLPYGGKARSFMSEIQTQVAKTGSTTIDLDRSMRAFANGHGIATNGRSLKMLANQAVHLGSATILLGYRDPKTMADVTLGGKVAKQVSIWSLEEHQPSLWPNTLELSTDFRDAILEHHVPISSEAMYALDHNALAQDVYVFLAYRLHALNPTKPTHIPWAYLHQQFEGIRFDKTGKAIRPEDIQSYYPWRKRAVQAIGQALQHYPAARVEITREDLVLRNSPPPVAKIISQKRLGN
jgi:hypothetical protein